MKEVTVGDFLENYIATLDAHELGSTLLDVPAPASDTGYSIRQLVADGHYHNNLHGLYSEIKSIFGSQLSTEALGSAAYSDLFAFFRFAADLFLRECTRLMLTPPAGPENIGDSFMLMLKQALQGIAADTEEWYGEALYVITQQDPMFTSLTGRASFDTREITERGAVHPTRILPYTSSAPEPYLGMVSPMQTRFPHPALPPTTILNNFSHPVSSPLSYTRWRDVDLAASFAPSHDDSGSVVPADEAALYYYTKRQEEILRKREQASRPQRYRSKSQHCGSTSGSASASLAGDYPDQDDQTGDSSDSGEASPASSFAVSAIDPGESPEPRSETSTPQPGSHAPSERASESLMPLDFANILGWTPGSFVDDDELEAAQAGTEVALVSKLLLQLQALQRQRFASTTGDLEVQDNELRLALKIQNILNRLACSDDGDELKLLKPSTKLPVKLRNYVGSLPLSEQAFPQPFPNQQQHQPPPPHAVQQQHQHQQHQRLASVNGQRGRVSHRRR